MQRCSILVLGPYVVEMRCLHNSRLLALSSSVNNIPAKNYNTDNLCGTGGQVPWQPGPLYQYRAATVRNRTLRIHYCHYFNCKSIHYNPARNT